MINFKTTKEEAILIGQIIKRARELSDNPEQIDTMSHHMDISACIANNFPLKLDEWLAAPDFDFVHDFYGITRHINRRTGKIEDCFLPRFAA